MKRKLKIIASIVAAVAVIAFVCFSIPVRSIEIRDLSNEEIFVGENTGYIFDISGGIFNSIKNFRVVSDNPEAADIECTIEGLSVIRFPMISITPKSEGTVTFYIETKDGKVKSNTATITVKNKLTK